MEGIKTIKDALDAHREIQKELPQPPWEIHRLFGDGEEIAITLGGIMWKGDEGSLEEWRNAVTWLAEQFGGKVKWRK